jgi:heme exporter protein C
MTMEFDDNPALPIWLVASTAILMLVSLYMIFIWVSMESSMEIIQRLFYFHVPAAIAGFTASYVGGVASILYLMKRDNRYDDLSLAANESILVFETVNIVMGSIWARRAWGIWWTWDARLTTAFLLVVIYAAYLMFRRAAPVEIRAVTCAVISILGMVDATLTYMANRLFRTQHPSPVILGGEGSGLQWDMGLTLGVSIAAMLMLWWCVVRVRRRVARLDRAVEDLSRRANELADVGGRNSWRI